MWAENSDQRKKLGKENRMTKESGCLLFLFSNFFYQLRSKKLSTVGRISVQLTLIIRKKNYVQENNKSLDESSRKDQLENEPERKALIFLLVVFFLS